MASQEECEREYAGLNYRNIVFYGVFILFVPLPKIISCAIIFFGQVLWLIHRVGWDKLMEGIAGLENVDDCIKFSSQFGTPISNGSYFTSLDKGNQSKKENQTKSIASAATAPVQEIIPLFEDAVLFKQPPPKPPCPICTLPLMATIPASKYQLCCGKTICCGCFYAVYKRTLKKQQAISKRTGRKIRTPLCPCCREPQPNIVLEDGKLKMGQALKKLLGDDPLGDPGTCNDATALVGAGEYYSGGIFGFTKNQDMAIKFWHRAADLGHSDANMKLAKAYLKGEGVEVNSEKSTYYLERSAILGNAHARLALGTHNTIDGNMNIAAKHFMIAARQGHPEALKEVKELFLNGYVAKDEYANTLRANQNCVDEMKSDDRDEAGAFSGLGGPFY